MKKKLFRFKWLGILAALFFAFIPQMKAQDVDDLQEYLDQLASRQTESQAQRPRKGQSIEIPVGLTEVDLSKFSYQNRTKTLTVKASVKFTNGIIAAASNYSGGTCLLKVYDGATVVLDATASIDAGAATSTNCLAAVGIYGGSTFYECGDITAPDNGAGIAIYIDGATDTFVYVSGELKGKIHNPNGGKVIGLEGYTKEQLLALLQPIGEELDAIGVMRNNAEAEYAKLSNEAIPENVRVYIGEIVAALEPYIAQYNEALATYDRLLGLVQAMTSDDDGTLHDQIVALQDTVDNGYVTIQEKIATLIAQIKDMVADDLAKRLQELRERYIDQNGMNDEQKARLIYMLGLVSDFRYFMLKDKDTHEFTQKMQVAETEVCVNKDYINNFKTNFNDLLNNHAIATFDDIVTYYTNYWPFVQQMEGIEARTRQIEVLVAEIQALFDTLEINFPDEELAFTIRPTGLDKELQLGYKSNRGFVLTSAGMMWFEQKEGADFYLTDADGNYIVATSGSTTLRAGTKEEATVWTGASTAKGYTFYSKVAKRYLGYNGINVNNAIIASTDAYGWTINESELDDLQAFLNLLAEEEDTSGGGMTDKDTLTIVMPDIDPDKPTPTKPFVFPVVPYPIHILPTPGGYWPIPRPTPGQTYPQGFHPYHIKEGSHVIMDDAMFRDLIGGHHVIYVEGILEININIYVYLTNWEWFIHVGPTGRVIWRPHGCDGLPRIKNEGTMDIEDGNLDYVENTGTVNHKHGIISWIVNRYIYRFTGGLINLVHNYGQHYHQGGNVLTARNFSGGTYTMTGGTVSNTVVNETDTVFVNLGTFYFKGGTIGGYGSRLIYHKGGVLRIDGGLFDFTHVKHYWIEAHSDYYIRGNYDYKPNVPVLLAPSVTIRILYNWIYKFNIVFIGGRPTPRYPLFWGDGFNLNSTFYTYINWQLPNKRWRWYVNETKNTIEPRDEEVEDEDDLMAYLDWLAENQDGESASTEEHPQELDLKGRDIVITKPVEWPAGTHVFVRNGHFILKTGWTYDRMFYIPATTTVRYEYVIIDLSSTTHYIINGTPVQRNIFEVYGDFHFGPGCHVTGYVNTAWQPTDTSIPGAVVYIDPAARFFLDGGRFDNVIFRVNTEVNIYVTKTIVSNVYVYIPTACRYDGFSFMAPWDGYRFTFEDLQRIIFWNSGTWSVRVLPSNGYLTLFDKIFATPTANIPSPSKTVESGTQVELSCAVEGATIYYTLDGSDPRLNTEARMVYDGTPITVNKNIVIKAMAVVPDMGRSEVATFVYHVLWGDVNNDGKVDIADGVTILNIMAGVKYNEIGDLNFDDEIDVADFVIVLNIMAGHY